MRVPELYCVLIEMGVAIILIAFIPLTAFIKYCKMGKKKVNDVINKTWRLIEIHYIKFRKKIGVPLDMEYYMSGSGSSRSGFSSHSSRSSSRGGSSGGGGASGRW